MAQWASLGGRSAFTRLRRPALADPGLSSAGFCSAPRHHTEPVSLRIPSRVVPSLDQNRAHTSSRRGGYGLSGYQTWWRSGRDSNSRTGYARYGISSADSQNRLISTVLGAQTSIRLELDCHSSSTVLQRNPVFGNAVAASQEMPRPPGQFLVVLEMALQASVSRRSAKTRRIILLRDRSVQRRVPVNQAELWRPGVVRSRPRRLSG